jgi:H+/Cl- antiporter ClcA
VAIALTAVAFDAVTGKGADQVLFSGEVQLAPLVEDAGSWAAPALALLVVVKAAAYGLSLSSFRGGPVFPALFIGAAAGLAIADLPGLSTTPAVAMAAGAMCVAMLRLPVTSVFLAAAMLTTSSALHVLPLVIVAVVVSHVVTDRLPAFMRLPAGHVGEPSPGAGNAPA